MKRITASIIIFCLISLSVTGCGARKRVNPAPNPSPDPQAEKLREFAVQSDRAGKALDAIMDAERSFVSNGVAKPATGKIISRVVMTSAPVLRIVVGQLRVYDFSIPSRDRIIAGVRQGIGTVRELNDQSLLGIDDPNIRNRLSTVLRLAESALAALLPLLEGVIVVGAGIDQSIQIGLDLAVILGVYLAAEKLREGKSAQTIFDEALASIDSAEAKAKADFSRLGASVYWAAPRTSIALGY